MMIRWWRLLSAHTAPYNMKKVLVLIPFGYKNHSSWEHWKNARGMQKDSYGEWEWDRIERGECS